MNALTRNRVAAVIGIAIALALPHIIYPVLALNIILWGLFAVAVDLLLGYGGLLSFGHAAFWGSGGYAAAILSRNFQMPFPLAVVAGIIVALALAVPIGYLSIRRRGIYFAMVTLAFAEMVFYAVNEWRPVTGGENGVQGVPRLLPGVNLDPAISFYYAALPFVLVALWFTYRIVRSPFGHVLVSIRDNEPRAQALGYPTHRYKLLVFLLSAGLSGLAGSLYTLGHGFASLDLVNWPTSGTVVMMTVLGGIGTLWGSLLGAAFVLLIQDWLSTWTNAPGVVTGAIFIITVLAFRRGLWVALRDLPGRLYRLTAPRQKPTAELSPNQPDVPHPAK